MEVNVKWREDLGEMALEGVGPLGKPVIMDSSPAFGGKGNGPSPMELVLIALGGCTAMDVLSILRKKRLDVKSLEIKINGERSEDYPKEFTKAEIKYIVTGKNIDHASVQRAIELSEQSYCGVAGTLRKECKISTSFEVKET
jgi:putative redox protein